MLNLAIAQTVDFCARHARLVALAAAAVALVSSIYAVRHFAITTDVSKLIAAPSAGGQKRLNSLAGKSIVAVVEAPTPENVDRAAERLVAALRSRPDVLRSVDQRTGGPFFQHNALLFMPLPQLQHVTAALTRARPSRASGRAQ
jgi:hypothetical protein